MICPERLGHAPSISVAALCRSARFCQVRNVDTAAGGVGTLSEEAIDGVQKRNASPSGRAGDLKGTRG